LSITLRLERPEDYRAVETLTREAFWGFTSPTCDEHYLVHLLRSVPAFLPELDFVAEMDGELVGNVMYSRAKVVDDGGKETEVLAFGPLSVLPAYWHRGVGSALMRHSTREAKQMGYRAIVFYGPPDYYPRFGFRNARAFGITTPNGKSFDALMAMPLYDRALDSVSGAFHEDPVFAVKSEEAEAFNRTFPPNMDMVAERTGTRANALWNTLRERFVDVRRLIDSLPRTLTYNDFYWTNLVVSGDYTSAMMLDFNLLGKGYAFADIRNVISSLNADANEAFLSEYGTNGIGENERLADAVLSPLTTLFLACEREAFPRWANASLEELKSGALLESLLRWLGTANCREES